MVTRSNLVFYAGSEIGEQLRYFLSSPLFDTVASGLCKPFYLLAEELKACNPAELAGCAALYHLLHTVQDKAGVDTHSFLTVFRVIDDTLLIQYIYDMPVTEYETCADNDRLMQVVCYWIE